MQNLRPAPLLSFLKQRNVDIQKILFQKILFQEILNSPYSSQAVNGVHMYPNTQCENENQGQGFSYDYRYMRQLCARNFSSCSKYQYLLEQNDLNFSEVKQKNI